MCGAKGSKAQCYGKSQVGSAANFCVAANMRGRTSGYTKVVVKIGPTGQTDDRHGRATTHTSTTTEQTQSSMSLERFHSLTVSALRTLLSKRGLSNVGVKKDLVERFATTVTGAMEEAQEDRHAGVFQDSSPTRLDTAELPQQRRSDWFVLLPQQKLQERTSQGTVWTQWQLKMPLAKQTPCIVQRGRKILRWLVTPST